MTMVESCILSVLSLVLMIWETMRRTELIKREPIHLSLDKVELMEEEEVQKAANNTTEDDIAFGKRSSGRPSKKGLSQIVPTSASTLLEKEKE